MLSIPLVLVIFTLLIFFSFCCRIHLPPVGQHLLILLTNIPRCCKRNNTFCPSSACSTKCVVMCSRTSWLLIPAEPPQGSKQVIKYEWKKGRRGNIPFNFSVLLSRCLNMIVLPVMCLIRGYFPSAQLTEPLYCSSGVHSLQPPLTPGISQQARQVKTFQLLHFKIEFLWLCLCWFMLCF